MKEPYQSDIMSEDNPGSYKCCKGLQTKLCPDCYCQYCPTNGHCQYGSIQYGIIQYLDGTWWHGCRSCERKRDEKMNEEEHHSISDFKIENEYEKFEETNQLMLKWKKDYNDLLDHINTNGCQDCINKCDNYMKVAKRLS